MKFLILVLNGLRLVGLIIHLWTLYIVFNIHGLIGAILAFFMPVLSQIYLFILSWNISGVIFTRYNTVIIVYIIGFIVWWILAFAVKSNLSENQLD